MTSYIARVFEIPELLEAVLAQLPLRDLLLAQRICTRFRRAITSSPTLQQLLFFRPEPFKDPKLWAVNPLLNEVLPLYFIMSEGRIGYPRFESIITLDFNRNSKSKEAFLYADASWRRMFLMQPPPVSMFIDRRSNSGRYAGVSRKTATILFERETNSGVTMDALYDITLQFTAQDEGQFFLSFNEHERSAPSMILYLHEKPQFLSRFFCWKDLKSQDEETTWEKVRYEDDRTLCRNDPWGTYDYSGWKTDLTTDHGGISSDEYESWTKDKARSIFEMGELQTRSSR